MSLLISLATAARALDAQRAGLAVSGENMANLNTDGYVRRRIDLAEGMPGMGGVEVQGVRAMRDRLLETRLMQELPAESRDRAIAEALSVVEATLGAPGEGMDAELTAFFDAFQALSLDPSSAVARDSVIERGRAVALAFNELSARFDDARAAADTEIRANIEEINTLSERIAQLNAAIGASAGVNVEGLVDELGVALKSLADLADISVAHRSDGGVDVSIANGRPLVVGASQYELVSATGLSGFVQVETYDGVDITSQIGRGRLSGFVSVRDTNIPAYQTRLDQLAYAIVQEVNALHQAGTDLNGGTGNDFFAALGSASGAAAAMAMNAAVLADSDLVAASATGAIGDNGIAKAIGALRDTRVMSGGSATFAGSWSQLLYRVGSDIVTARAQAEGRHDVVAQIRSLIDQIEGVSLDEEAAIMLRFQRGYEANAKYFSTVDRLLDTLMGMV